MRTDEEGYSLQWFCIIFGLSIILPVLTFSDAPDKWVVLVLLIFPVLPGVLGLLVDRPTKLDRKLSQHSRDLAWWITERHSTDNPIYQQVCDDMITYLEDMGARR